MNLWGVAELELDSHPEHNKGTDHSPCPCPMSKDPSQKLILLQNVIIEKSSQKVSVYFLMNKSRFQK